MGEYLYDLRQRFRFESLTSLIFYHSGDKVGDLRLSIMEEHPWNMVLKECMVMGLGQDKAGVDLMDRPKTKFQGEIVQS